MAERCHECGTREPEPWSPFAGYCYRCGAKHQREVTALWLRHLEPVLAVMLRYTIDVDGYEGEAASRYCWGTLTPEQQLGG